MSQHFVAVSSLPAEGERFDVSRFSKLAGLLKLVAIAGVVLSAVFFALGGDSLTATSAFNGHEVKFSLRSVYAYSWLFAFFVGFTFCLGGLFWVLLHNASNSGWGVAIRRIPEVLSTQLFIVGILGLPLVVWPQLRETLWEWIRIHADAAQHGPVREYLHEHNHLLAHKYPYLNLYSDGFLPGWLTRYFVYFLILGFGALQLRHYSVGQDHTGAVRPTLSARRFSCGWLPLFAICLTFAGFDWIKGLNYTWFSTMFGVNVFAGAAQASMGLLIVIVVSLMEAGYLKRVVTNEHLHLMGKLMLAFTIFWAYIAFSQYFLTWYANIAEETQFYAVRNTEGWRWYSILLVVIGHFFLPFLLLLRQDLKKKPKIIRRIALWVIFAHICEIYWFIIPERGPKLADRPTIGWAIFLDLIALATVVSIVALAFLRSLGKQSLYPVGDPRLQESINVAN